MKEVGWGRQKWKEKKGWFGGKGKKWEKEAIQRHCERRSKFFLFIFFYKSSDYGLVSD